jgi:starch-binding outer membrane protein, SusD/RagB family
MRSFILIISLSTIFFSSCTKLKENVGSNLTQGQVTTDSSYVAVLLQGVYSGPEYSFTSYQEIFPLSELTTDEAIAPTRGPDWDDNGEWRVFHQQKYDPANAAILQCFNHLSGIVYLATDMLQYKPTASQQAQARFIRAFVMYWLLDLYDQVPYRNPGESTVPPARVRKGMDALNYIISEINAVEPDLPDGPANRANKDAAKVLLMKCYLNKGVYMNRVNPAFDPADMNKVIGLADSIIRSGKYTFSSNYFDNFSPGNSDNRNENIFTQASSFDGYYYLFLSWLLMLEYNQYPSNPPQQFQTANGFTTLSDFYDKFDSTDKRRGIYYPYSPNSLPNPGRRVNVGFLIGQQYDLNVDTALRDRNLPLIYTREIQNIEPGPNLLMSGIRAIKYAPDFLSYYVPGNEFVYFRFPDVLLMKAEAILRGGTPTSAGTYGSSALEIVNTIRTDPSRGTSPLTSLNPDDLLDERGRELWWENWRRQDMIRFGKFLLPFQQKDYTSDSKYLLFPIPYEQLGVNHNLVQNPGY